MKPQDSEAANVRFGIELETQIPQASGVSVGGYHHGNPVLQGVASTGETLPAPNFNGATWKAERDGSIQYEPGMMPCEFVSPILHGDAGVEALVKFVEWLNAIGAKVNNSTGCHVTVGIEQVIGTNDTAAIGRFVRNLVSICKQNAWAIYGQTGAGRHNNHYSHQLGANTPELLDQILAAAERGDRGLANALCAQCGRGMVNLQKAFRPNPAIEFRAFAGTTNLAKIFHHIATAIGLMRRAAIGKNHMDFNHKAAKSAPEALRRMWRLLGWTSYRRQPVALGLFGTLYREYVSYRKTALAMAQKFETRFPHANL